VKNPKSFIFPGLLVLVMSLALGPVMVNKFQSFIIIITLVLTTLWDYMGMKRKAKKEATTVGKP
ncbi:MAG: hypothetical protein RR216_04185, partial [Pseudoflavonifractor sp.]